MTLGTAVIRGVVGPLFVGHGAQKLFGAFGGHGREGTGGFFETLGLRPGRRHATAAGVAETAGGALLTLGALTPLATSLISGTMITAIRKVHGQNGPWVTENGYEYNATLVAVMTALADTGPGRLSVDHALFPRLKGPAWAIASLGAAAAASYLATERFTEPAPAPAEGQADIPGDPAAPQDEQPAAAEEPRFTREPAEVPAESTTA